MIHYVIKPYLCILLFIVEICIYIWLDIKIMSSQEFFVLSFMYKLIKVPTYYFKFHKFLMYIFLFIINFTIRFLPPLFILKQKVFAKKKNHLQTIY
jgi:hypothetical protein